MQHTTYLNAGESFVAWLARQIGECKWIVARSSKKRRKEFDRFFTQHRFRALERLHTEELAAMEASAGHLTEPNKDLEDKRRKTPPGMAHWAGTGPAGKTCRQCEHWQFNKDNAWAVGSGLLREVPCEKYTRMMNGADSPAIPHYSAACKYFEQAPFEPSIERPTAR